MVKAYRSDFTYNFRIVKDKDFLMIEDLNLGRMSVTNNIENIVELVCRFENRNPVEIYIIYKDSDGMWDGYEFSTMNFIPLREEHWIKAAIKMTIG